MYVMACVQKLKNILFYYELERQKYKAEEFIKF